MKTNNSKKIQFAIIFITLTVLGFAYKPFFLGILAIYITAQLYAD
jgi:hypothetical protein